MRINIKDCIKNSLQKHVLSLIFVTHHKGEKKFLALMHACMHKREKVGEEGGREVCWRERRWRRKLGRKEKILFTRDECATEIFVTCKRERNVGIIKINLDIG